MWEGEEKRVVFGGGAGDIFWMIDAAQALDRRWMAKRSWALVKNRSVCVSWPV